MELSSERLVSTRKTALQIRTMDDGLRNRLWSVVFVHFLRRAKQRILLDLLDEIWCKHFRRPVDELPSDLAYLDENDQLQAAPLVVEVLKQEFLDGTCYQDYDLLEFIAQNHPIYEDEGGDFERTAVLRFMNAINSVLEEELSGYRIIQSTVSPITNKDEIDEDEVALDSPAPVALHIQRALELLSDKVQPDYRNSITVALSAVESIGNLIADVTGESLGAVLPQLSKQLGLQLHGALRKALGSLYGWTSDEGGVRHALLEESDLTQEDARFMLIVCSAFVNYLKTKTANAGISLDANV